MASMEGSLEADIESGLTIPISSEGKRVLSRTCSGLSKFGGLRVQNSEEEPGNVAVVNKNPSIEYRDLLDFLEKGCSKKTSLPNSTKHFKPPRPPKGPSLSASDMRLVKEISDLVAMKRARIERVRALKKKKVAKASSSSSSAAMFITILFFIVVIFQGVTGSGVSL